MFKMKKKWILSLVLVLVVSLAVVGCTNDADDSEIVDPAVEEDLDEAADDVDDATDNVQDAVEDAKDDARDMTYEDITVTPEEAFDTFMGLHPDAKITEFDLDKELMDYQYVIEGYDTENSYEVKIHPVDGTVISDDTEVFDLEDETAEITKDHLGKIDSIIDKAIIEDGSNADLDEWNLSVDEGRVVMDVEIGMTEYSYDMDTENLIDD